MERFLGYRKSYRRIDDLNRNRDYTDVLKNIIDDELEGRCSESECAVWLSEMGLTAEDLTELGYGYLNDIFAEEDGD